MVKKVGEIIRSKIIVVTFAMIAVVMSFIMSNKMLKNDSNVATITDPEILRAMTYEQVTEEDRKIENCDFVQFSAFFLRDLNGDGIAEDLKGTCKKVNEKDSLYFEINVLTKGYLKDAEITLNAENFKWNTSLVRDKIIDGNYIGETQYIKLKEIRNGTQGLYWGGITANLGNNINNYSKIGSMTLTGTYVDEDGTETNITKTSEFIVDWYGETKTKVSSNSDGKTYDIDACIDDEKFTATFDVKVNETAGQLILQKSVAEVQIPELNGYKPLNVTVNTSNQENEYDEDSRALTITRTSSKDSEGRILNQLARENVYSISVEYPKEAYDSIGTNTIILDIPIKGYSYGYNNPNEEFQNPYVSEDSTNIKVTYSEPIAVGGATLGLNVNVGKLLYNGNTGRYEYVVSKEYPQKIYNGNIYEDDEDLYEVEWNVFVGNKDEIKTIVVEEQKNNDENKVDTFDDNASMYNYITTKGIYFNNISTILGDDGWIKLYDAELDTYEIINGEDFSRYTKENPFEVNLKSLKIETSTPVSNGTLKIYQVKEIDDQVLTADITEEEFDAINYIYTYAQANYITSEDESEALIYDTDKARYQLPYSKATLSINKSEITNQEMQNVTYTITASSDNFIEKKWKDGIFVLELPEEIINLEVNEVYVEDDLVEISSYQVYKENNKYYIRINTTNDEEENFNIKINANIFANPLNETRTVISKLYSYNPNCDNYGNETEDVYDIDGDNLITDKVSYSTASIKLIAPSGLITAEYVTNYDDFNSVTIAPNIAEVEKENQSRTATINVNLTNNYSNTISDIVILGKIPFEGNTYILNVDDIGSEYDTKLNAPINIPTELQSCATVYYSTNENPTNDLTDESNGWQTIDEVTDLSNVKCYLIDLTGYTLQKSDDKVFSYDVMIPARLGYNTVSYSTHAVYFNLDTEEGKRAARTEPSKVGVQIVGKYNFELTKNKRDFDNVLVNGASYEIKTTDIYGNIISKVETTDQNGKLTFSNLYIEKEYTLKEIACSDDYILSDEEITFYTRVDENGDMIVTINQGSFKENVEVVIDENENYKLKAKIEDEAKVTLNINKTTTSGLNMKDVKYRIEGNNFVKNYRTDSNGNIEVKGLNIGTEYTIKEMKADGFYVDQNYRKFKVKRNENGVLVIETDDDILSNAVLQAHVEGEQQSQLNVEFVNEEIPKFNLQILKVEENNDITDPNSMNPLAGAIFSVYSVDDNVKREYTTDQSGVITIEDLYIHEDSYITGEYVIKEVKAPAGYSNNREELRIKVERNENDLNLIIEDQENKKSYNSYSVDNNTVKLILQDKPLFRLIKVDKEKSEFDDSRFLANAKFIIYEINEEYIDVDDSKLIIDYAKDVNGNYIGVRDEHGYYIVTTDENGEITLPLREGYYKAVEVGYPEGYLEDSNYSIFKIIGEENKEDDDNIIEVNYIEDLVDIALNVNNGTNRYANQKIVLQRDLDFNDINSYYDDTSVEYGDLNGNGTVSDIKTELTTGNGWMMIGSDSDSTRYFMGEFDGNNCTISNLYNHSSNRYVGLFGCIYNGTVKNLSVSGVINRYGGTYNDHSRYEDIGGIAGYIENGVILNCNNYVEIHNSNYPSGGYGSLYNTNSEFIGGIAGYAKNSTICDCKNYGSLSSDGGKPSKANEVDTYIGGIVGYSRQYNKIMYCRNEGNLTTDTYCIRGQIGGITAYSSYGDVIECCSNIGKITATVRYGSMSYPDKLPICKCRRNNRIHIKWNITKLL